MKAEERFKLLMEYRSMKGKFRTKKEWMEACMRKLENENKLKELKDDLFKRFRGV